MKLRSLIAGTSTGAGRDKVRADKVRALLSRPPPLWPRFTSQLHDEAVTARVGRVLGYCFTLCFVTGLLSHYQYHPWNWLPVPAAPQWGYRLSQGLHVTSGIVAIPLLLVKLWTVYPRLFEWPPAKSVLHGLERLSVGLLVSSALIELGTGFLNILGWYPWPWHFVIVHFLLAFVVFGSVVLHVAVKYEVIKRGLATPLGSIADGAHDETDTNLPPSAQLVPQTSHPVGLSRRGLLVTAGIAAGAVTVTTAGRTFAPLDHTGAGLLQDRQPKKAPLGVPINTTANEAKVVKQITDPAYRLHVLGPQPFDLTLEELESLDAQGAHFPLACVEGWSVSAHWSGPMLIELVQRAGGSTDSHVRVESFQKGGSYRTSMVYGPQLSTALLATHLNGERITSDHGYPLRLIAPDRSGVLNTKWLTNIVVLT